MDDHASLAPPVATRRSSGPASSSPTRPQRLAVLRDGNARRLVAGQIASQICDRMALAGILWFLTGAAGETLVAWYIAIGGLPHLALAWRAGPIINTLGALRVVVWADLVRGVIFLTAAALLTALPRSADIVVLFTLTLFGNIGSALFNPAILALPVRLARRDAYQPNQLTALLSSCGAIGNIVGPALAALVYKAGGLEAVPGLTAAAYLGAGLIERDVRLPSHQGAAGSTAGRNFSGAMAVRRYPLVGYLLGLLLLINLCIGPIVLFLPLFAATVFTGGIDILAWLQSSLGGGMIAGGLAIAALTLPGPRPFRIVVPAVLTAACYLGFTLSASLGLSCLLLAGLGASLAAANAGIIGVFQTVPDESDVPAVMAMVNLFGVASLPLSMAVIGVLLGSAPASTVAPCSAAAALLIALASPAIPGLKETPSVRLAPAARR